MLKKIICAVAIYGASLSAHTISPISIEEATHFETSRYFNTHFLREGTAVRAALLEDGFIPVRFTSRAGFELEGYWRHNPQAQYCIIAASGFFPGKMTGIATLSQIAPDCSLLLFNERGKGNSNGKLAIAQIWKYGTDNYQDILGAVEFAAKNSTQPIILFGVCAGAFHVLHAVHHKDMTLHAQKIKGAIVESLVPIPRTAARTVIPGRLEKLVPNPFLRAPLALCVWSIIFALDPLMRLCEEKLTLEEKVWHFDIPILAIHGEKDQEAPLALVEDILNNVPCCWRWILPHEHSHANIMLKHKAPYAAIVRDFCDRVAAEEILQSCTVCAEKDVIVLKR